MLLLPSWAPSRQRCVLRSMRPLRQSASGRDRAGPVYSLTDRQGSWCLSLPFDVGEVLASLRARRSAGHPYARATVSTPCHIAGRVVIRLSPIVDSRPPSRSFNRFSEPAILATDLSLRRPSVSHVAAWLLRCDPEMERYVRSLANGCLIIPYNAPPTLLYGRVLFRKPL